MNKNNLVGLLAVVSLLGGSVLLSACNTMQGAGKDVQAGGKAIEKCADPDSSTCKAK